LFLDFNFWLLKAGAKIATFSHFAKGNKKRKSSEHRAYSFPHAGFGSGPIVNSNVPPFKISA
jgi:hypothetical protein